MMPMFVAIATDLREMQSHHLSVLVCKKWPQVGTQANIGVGRRLVISYNGIQQDEFKVFKEAAKFESVGTQLAGALPMTVVDALARVARRGPTDIGPFFH